MKKLPLIYMALIIISLLLATNAGAQDEFKNKIELEDITPAWMNFCPSDLRVSGDYLYGVDFEMFNVYDVSNPAMPVWKNSIREFGGCDLVVADGYAFVSYFESVVAFDIDPVETMKELSRVKIPDFPYQMCLFGNYLYVFSDDMDRNSFLHIIDVSDPSKIVQTGEMKLDRDIQTFEVFDEKTLIATNYKGIVIIDTSDPKAPKISQAIEGEISPSEYGLMSSDDNISEIVIANGYAYATFGEPEMNIFDIDPIETAHLVGAFKFENAARIVGLNGNTLYAEDIKDYDARKLQLVDISNNESPVIIRTYDLTLPIPYLRFNGNYAYSYDPWGGMAVFDFSSEKLSTTHLSACVDITVLSGHNNFIYAATPRSLMVIDVSDPHKASVINTVEPLEGIADILFKDDLMILIYGRKIQLAETDNKGNVNFVKTIEPDMERDSVGSPIVIGEYLYYFTSSHQFKAVNLKIPSLAFVEFSFDDFAYSFIQKIGDILLAFKNDQVDVLTFSEGKRPELLKTVKFGNLGKYPESPENVVIGGDLALLFFGYYGMKVLDISNPENPVLRAEYKDLDSEKALMLEDFVILESDLDTWGVWYKEPFLTGKEFTWDDALFLDLSMGGAMVQDMFIMGNYIYITYFEGLRIFDLSGLSNLPPYSDVP